MVNISSSVSFTIHSFYRDGSRKEGKMLNGHAAGLGLSTLVGALVHGNAKDVAAVDAAHAGTGLKVGREMLENIAADTVAKGYKGLPFIREMLRRTDGWAKYGLEALSIAAAPAIASQLGKIAGNLGLDAKTRGYLEMAFVDLAEGVSRGAITASDPNREAKIDALVVQVKKRFDNAFRDHLGVIHLARLADDGSVQEDSATPSRPLSCVHWQQMTSGWDSQHPDIIVRANNNGGNNNQNQNQGRGRDIPGLKIPYERGSYDVFAAGTTEPHLCPACFSLRGTAAKPAENAAAWWPKVDGNAAVKRVLLAVTHKVGKDEAKQYVMVDLLEDLEKACSFEAIKILCEDIDPRLVEVQQFRQETDAAGVITEVAVGKYDEISDADMKHFRVWIDGLGGAELTMASKAKAGLFDLKEHFARFMSGKDEKDASGKAKNFWPLLISVAIAAAGIVIGYMCIAPVVTLAIWAVGVFVPDGYAWINISAAMVSTLFLILWLTPWYTSEGIKKVFGGLLSSEVDANGSPGLANLARNITALFVGSSLLALLELFLGTISGVDSTLLRAFSVPGAMLGAIAVDRLAAAWLGSQKITEWREKYTLRTAVSVSAIGLIILVVGAIAMAKSWYDGPPKTEAEKAEQVEVVQDMLDVAQTDAKARIAEAEAAKAQAEADAARARTEAAAQARAEATAKAVAEADALRIAPKAEVAKAETDAEKCARIAHYSYTTRRSAGCVK